LRLYHLQDAHHAMMGQQLQLRQLSRLLRQQGGNPERQPQPDDLYHRPTDLLQQLMLADQPPHQAVDLGWGMPNENTKQGGEG
jgi:hypothetical protein